MTDINLDDFSIYRKLDPEDMLARIKEFPMQCSQAWQSVMKMVLPKNYSNINQLVILGMGGSAIGGDLVRTLVQEEMKIPVIVHRDYGLPAFVDDRTLLIASSYSGNTEETLSGFESALKMGAKKLVITSGGKLEEMAKVNNIPVFKIKYKALPRAALGYSFMPTLGVLQKLGFIQDKSADVAEIIQVLEKLSSKLDEKSPLKANPAKQLAQRLFGCLPVVYGAGIAAEAAHRWKTQFNENAKSWAFYDIFPELNHNAATGYSLPKDIASKIRVVLLRSPTFSKRIKLRYDVTCELLKQSGVAYEFVDSEGKSSLSQIVSLVSIGDYVSYYLALLYKVDPSPIKYIDYLKERLAKG
ncbi:MAG: bifunctional phosphoglucose/phosphomannose isomerase [Chloroflexi bacterium RBG_13_51_18]|nr:MAG: bifunctional phosphoglucose/phosphomannose isomerase [Chloroflexi bacterium RBG_13_51_18]